MTPHISANSGTVNVKTEVRNDAARPEPCTLKTDIVGPDGATVATVSSTQVVPPGATLSFDQTTGAIPRPKLWHANHRFLYRAISTD